MEFTDKPEQQKAEFDLNVLYFQLFELFFILLNFI